MSCPHLSEASGARAGVPRMSQAFTPRHRAEVGPPTNQSVFRDGVIYRQGLAHRLFRGLHMETPHAAGRGFNQTLQVVHLDGIVGETDPGRLEPLDPAHPRLGIRGLSLRLSVGRIQQGVQKGADAVGVQVLGSTKLLGQEPPAGP